MQSECWRCSSARMCWTFVLFCWSSGKNVNDHYLLLPRQQHPVASHLHVWSFKLHHRLVRLVAPHQAAWQQRYCRLLTRCDEVCWNVNTPRRLSLARRQHLQTSAELSPSENRTLAPGREEAQDGADVDEEPATLTWRWRGSRRRGVREEVSGVTAGYSSSLLTDLMSRLYGRSALTGDN